MTGEPQMPVHGSELVIRVGCECRRVSETTTMPAMSLETNAGFSFRRILGVISLLVVLGVAGVSGFRAISGEKWVDCIYMTVITLSTIGFHEVIPLDDRGKIFVSIYVVFSLGIVTYCAFQLGQAIVGMEIQSLLERRRIHNMISKLRDHYIVCGAGRMGVTICEYLHERGIPFVAVDVDEEQIRTHCDPAGWLSIVGDATDDDVLQAAGIKTARGLATALPTDANNVYVILSARMLRKDMSIISRASEDSAIVKMQRAGATRVISPFSTGAVKMARFMLNPSIEDFFDITDSRGNEMELADIQIDEGSPYVGKPLAQTDLRKKGIMIIGIRRRDGQYLMPPSGEATIEMNDCLLAFGKATAIQELLISPE